MTNNGKLTKIFTLKTLVIVGVASLGMAGLYIMDSKEKSMVHISEHVLDSNDAWAGGLKPSRPEKMCIDGVSYLYIHSIFVGGMAPEYINGSPVQCDAGKEQNLSEKYRLSKVCRKGQMYYHLHKGKGAAVSLAVEHTGESRQCRSS